MRALKQKFSHKSHYTHPFYNFMDKKIVEQTCQTNLHDTSNFPFNFLIFPHWLVWGKVLSKKINDVKASELAVKLYGGFFGQYFWFFPLFSKNTVKKRVSPFSSDEKRFTNCSFLLKPCFFENLMRSYISRISMSLNTHYVF